MQKRKKNASLCDQVVAMHFPVVLEISVMIITRGEIFREKKKKVVSFFC